METVKLDADVEREDVAIAEDAVARYSVQDLVFDRRTDARGLASVV